MRAKEFWEQDDVVEEFAGREPDKRLIHLLGRYATPGGTRVLDIGCAGGRNTALLAERGFDVYALDTSTAMVRRTRERVTPVFGAEAAAQRVVVGRMQDLSHHRSGSFDLLVALGVYHDATGQEDWERTIEETARVLKPGGQVLVSAFTPQSEPHGEVVREIPGQPNMYTGFSSGSLFLLEADDFERHLARRGLEPVERTQAVIVPTDEGFRVSLNGLFEKMP